MSKLIIPTKGIFKHDHVVEGYFGMPYLLYESGNPIVDGINRGHVKLYGRCEICNEKILVGLIHTDNNGTLYKLNKDKKS